MARDIHDDGNIRNNNKVKNENKELILQNENLRSLDFSIIELDLINN